jgi:predicted porin
MQKKLIALAVAGMASTAAFAQSNVTIYGLLQPSYDFMNVKGGSATNTDVTDMAYNNSRIGFKGEEALGNGLKAIFQIESKVDLANRGEGTTGFGDRDSFVGLAGAFGSLTFGNHQTAYKKVADFADPFADSIGDYNNIMAVYGQGGALGAQGDAVGGAGYVDGADTDFNRRVNKSAYYVSPKFAGFQVAASYGLKAPLVKQDGVAGKQDESILSIGANYTLGGLGLMAAYEKQNQKELTVTPDAESIDAWKVGGSYKFSFGTQINAIYEKMEQNNVFDVKHYFVSATHPITSNIDLMASYIKASDDKITAGDQGARNYNLGVNYKFSKRTSVQGIYTNLKNEAQGNYVIDSNGYGAAGATGYKVSGFSVRLRHAF